jgi:hypothetical protein
MNPDSENFNELRRLLVLKRHEQPPPGYFNNFSRQVIARIEAGEQSREGRGHVSWLQWLRGALEAKPAFAGAFGAMICAVVISGIMYSEEAGMASRGVGPMAGEMTPPISNPAPLAMNTLSERPQFGSSTNPVAPVLTSLFDQFQLRAQPASANFGLPGGN